jgi:predicted aconitase with swiveling domain
MVVIPAKPVIKGQIEAEVLFSRKPISFIGGVDPQTGIIRDPLNDCQGQSIADKVYIFPFGKGSSGAGLVLLELTRVGKAPVALVNLRTDTVLMTGPLICREFYKKIIPVVNVDQQGMDQLAIAKRVNISADGTSITIME